MSLGKAFGWFAVSRLAGRAADRIEARQREEAERAHRLREQQAHGPHATVAAPAVKKNRVVHVTCVAQYRGLQRSYAPNDTLLMEIRNEGTPQESYHPEYGDFFCLSKADLPRFFRFS